MNPFLRRFATALLAPCLFLAGLTTVHAGMPPTGGGTKPKPRPKIPYMAIASIDTTAKTITIEPKNSTATGTKVFKFTDKTKVTVSGHDATIADLKAGQQIRVGTDSDPDTASELTATDPPPDPK